MRKNRKTLKILLAVLALICLAAAVYEVVSGMDKVKTSSSSDEEVFTATDYLRQMSGIRINGEYYKKKAGLKVYLFIGLDSTGPLVSSSSYRNLNNADFLILVAVDSVKKTVNLVEIDRDTMVQIRRLDLFGNPIGPVAGQIALSYSYGDGLSSSAMNTLKTVGDLFYGLDIDYYYAVNMDGALAVLDMFGAVPVLLDQDYTDINESYSKGRVVTMTAEEAFSFIRARRGLEDPTNQARIRRQQLYINALIDKLESTEFTEEQISALVATGSDCAVSNIDLNAVSLLAQAVDKYTVKRVISINGEETVVEEHMEFYPDEESLSGIATDIFYDKF